jgi:GDPmannose 4,6-dehydratase
MKKALITGITGQDGSYLSEYLLELGYEVHGIVLRKNLEDPSHFLWRLNNILDKITLHVGSLESFPSLFSIMQKVMPDECYHLAAQSFVSYSFEDEFSTMNVNINGTHYILSAVYSVCPNCHFYFAGSSEMFGKAEEMPQSETTKFHPRSVYGISKVAGFELTKNYRERYKMFACSGILFNHESPRRGFEYVTRKITFTVAKIKLGLAKEIRLGNIDAKRDWGFAGDYIKAMHAMLNQETPEDFVVGTGKVHSVKEFLEIAFGELRLDYQKYLIIDPTYFRPADAVILVADAAKARKKLGWQPSIGFEELICKMIRSDYDYLQNLT